MTDPAHDNAPDLDNCSPVEAARLAAGHLVLVEDQEDAQLTDKQGIAEEPAEHVEADKSGLPLAHRSLVMGSGATFASPTNDGKISPPVMAFNAYVSSLDHRCTASPDYSLTPDIDALDVLGKLGASLLDVTYDCPDYNGSLRLDQVHASIGDCHLLIDLRRSAAMIIFRIQACAPNPASLDATLRLIDSELRPCRYVAPPARAAIRAWWMTANGPTSSRDYIDAPSFSETRTNYPPQVAGDLNHMMQMMREGHQRIHVWYGPPGTGKTSAVRAIAQDLASELEVHVVMDPEQLLKGGIAYMMQIISACKQTDKPYLLILEDTGQMVTVDAGRQHAEALSRLLNLTDGILGQNAKISVLITTNEPIGTLHEALLRPGRCGSQIDFCAFTREQAEVWCAEHDVDHALVKTPEITLAELYSLGSPESAPVRSASSSRKAKLGFCMNDEVA
jgi:hypothetical protein